MYKNIEILDTKKHEKSKFDIPVTIDVAKNVGIIPLGVDEVFDMCSIAPVIISSGEESEFIAFTGVSKDVSIYKKINRYFPRFLLVYPFLSINVKNEKGEINTVIAIDNNNFIGEDKKYNIFNKKNELEQTAKERITLVRQLNTQREISKSIIKTLKEKELLLKKDFKLKLDDGEKTILNEFYVVNREKLLKLDDATLALWAKKGWMGIIDAHLRSLGNFQKIFQ